MQCFKLSRGFLHNMNNDWDRKCVEKIMSTFKRSWEARKIHLREIHLREIHFTGLTWDHCVMCGSSRFTWRRFTTGSLHMIHFKSLCHVWFFQIHLKEIHFKQIHIKWFTLGHCVMPGCLRLTWWKFISERFTSNEWPCSVCLLRCRAGCVPTHMWGLEICSNVLWPSWKGKLHVTCCQFCQLEEVTGLIGNHLLCLVFLGVLKLASSTRSFFDVVRTVWFQSPSWRVLFGPPRMSSVGWIFSPSMIQTTWMPWMKESESLLHTFETWKDVRRSIVDSCEKPQNRRKRKLMRS